MPNYRAAAGDIPASLFMTIKMLVADDHEVVRLGLKALLHDTEIKIIGEAATAEELIRLASKGKPDLVLLDVRLGNEDGLDVLGRLKLEHSKLPVLVFSAYDNPTYVARAVALRAAGYVLKGDTRARLLAAIRAAAAGESTWTRDELRRVTGALATPRIAADVDVPLTHRESEVLRQLALGQTNKEIAQALEISYETVKEHVQHILRKIGVADRTQAAVWSVRKGLV
jgi:DNA-binding NarL/FixJ family response regulator